METKIQIKNNNLEDSALLNTQGDINISGITYIIYICNIDIVTSHPEQKNPDKDKYNEIL